MSEVRSKDGTRIAYDRTGDGPAVILVDGALCSRAMGPMEALAAQLADRFTVFRYDRRGRGESGDTLPYAVDREVEDLAALIDAAGGSADVCGVSSGAALALEAANKGLPIRKLVLYEAPFIVDGTRPPLLDDYRDALTQLARRRSPRRRGGALHARGAGAEQFIAMLCTSTLSRYRIAVVRPLRLWQDNLAKDSHGPRPPDGGSNFLWWDKHQHAEQRRFS